MRTAQFQHSAEGFARVLEFAESAIRAYFICGSKLRELRSRVLSALAFCFAHVKQ